MYLKEVFKVKFKQAGLDNPKPIRVHANTNLEKYCQYHKAIGQETEECIHLAKAIEDLIQQGQLERFVKYGGVYSRRQGRQYRKNSVEKIPKPSQVEETLTFSEKVFTIFA